MHLYVILRTHLCHTPLRVYIVHSTNARYTSSSARYMHLSCTSAKDRHAICTSAYVCMPDACAWKGFVHTIYAWNARWTLQFSLHSVRHRGQRKQEKPGFFVSSSIPGTRTSDLLVGKETVDPLDQWDCVVGWNCRPPECSGYGIQRGLIYPINWQFKNVFKV